MTLKELVEEAKTKSPSFKFKFEWWVNTRGKTPNLEWLMPLLEDALGVDYVVGKAQEAKKKNNL